jgi:hypothetical protein
MVFNAFKACAANFVPALDSFSTKLFLAIDPTLEKNEARWIAEGARGFVADYALGVAIGTALACCFTPGRITPRRAASVLVGVFNAPHLFLSGIFVKRRCHTPRALCLYALSAALFTTEIYLSYW